MDRAVWRLLVICAAWSIGAVLVWIVGARGLETAVPALFAAAAYLFTRDEVRPGRGGQAKYWRGRRIDDDRRRWH